MLDLTMGYGQTSKDLQSFILRGSHGMNKLFTWFQACVVFLHTNAAVLEPRVNKLCAALQEWYSEKTNMAVVMTASVDTSCASTEDDDEIIIVDAPPRRFRTLSPERCRGFLLDIPAGTSPYEVYPFALHTARALAWNVYATAKEIRLFSLACTHTTASSTGICFKCQALDRDSNLMGIRTRMATGYKSKSQYSLLPTKYLIERLRQQAADLEKMRLLSLNVTRSLATKTSAVSDMKRIVMAISKQPISRVHVVLTVALKKGRGVNGILDQLELARQNLYKPKSYDEAEFHKMALFSRLGGARVAFLAQRSSNLPSSRTTDRHLKVAPLQASPGYPTSQEMELNLYRQFRADDDYSDFAGLTEIPCSVPVDEIKIQERLRWDAKTDMILGTCREHGARNVALEFRSLAVADALLNALTHKKSDGTDVHLAREATVIAVRVHSQGSRLNHARPFVVSGTCKHESIADQQSLLRDALQALKRLEPIGLPTGARLRVYTLDSDGDSKRRLAAAELTLSRQLSLSTPTWQLLHNLDLMNLLCGEDELVMNVDFNHLFKRMRNTILRAKGITIANVFLTSSIIRHHLIDSGLEAGRVDTLLAVNDKQNVPLAQGLLSAVAALPLAGKEESPLYRESRRALRVLGFFYGHALSPYTDVRLSLGEQLEHLSALAHLALGLYSQYKGGFVPVQLYFDIMTTIKAAYFSVAKAQVANPGSSFWLILLGTDSLEKLFGIVRTMIGNDVNADQLQLASRLGSASLCAQLLQLHPEWDKGPNRLKLRPMEAGTVSRSYDHITPSLWAGDLNVSNVILRACWQRGATIASEELASCGIAHSFRQMHDGGLDILCPFQPGHTVLLHGLTAGEREEDDEERDLPGTEVTIEELEPDLEDVINSDPSSSLPDEAGRNHYDAFIETAPGKKQHKGTILKIYSSALTVKDSKDRLKRVCGLSAFNNPTPASSHTPNINDDHATMLTVEDPIATLVRSDGKVWLALGIVVEIKVNGTRVSTVPTSLASESNVRLRAQIMKLKPIDSANSCSDDGEQWEWTGSYEALTGQTSSRELDGRYVETINPSTEFSTQPGKQEEKTYRIASSTLRFVAAVLYERIRENNETSQLPTIGFTATFPYRSTKGDGCFLCKVEGESDATYQDRYRCTQCPSLPLELGPKLLEHMGAHILCDPALVDADEPCGLCLSSGSSCAIRLRKGPSGADIIDMDYSRCSNLYKIQLASARKSTANSPCSNTPMHCPVCPPKSNAVWRYNMARHLRTAHKLSADSHMALHTIEDSEYDAMKLRYNATPRNNAKKKLKDVPSHALSISLEHISSVHIGYVSII
ncbi:hypothetical protein BC629DRAFT_1651952 [Irpex lacteus]|nr:hypothetical protein BC629DRAFT_1651952 [Irpex lacteus]